MTKKSKNSNNSKQLTKAEVDSVISLYSSGQIHEAIKQINALNDKYPNVPLLFNILGACFKALGQLENAEQMFKNAFTIKPDYAEAYFNYGVIQKLIGNIDEAINSYEKAVSILPNYPDAHNNLGNAYREIGKTQEAIDSYEWAVAYNSRFAQAFNNLGIAYRDLNKMDLAFESFEKSFSINSDFTEPLFNSAILHKDLGNKDLSELALKKLIAIDPNYFSAYRNLSGLVTFSKNDPLIAQMESLYSDVDINQSDSIDLCFALSKAYEDLGDKRKQFKFLNEANKLRKNELNYSFQQSLELHLTIKKIFNKPLPKIKKSLYSDSNIRPIFIVGMPRSGTSLVEQILASHKKVFGAGELSFLNEILGSLIKNINTSSSFTTDLLALRENYFSKVSSIGADENIVIDKMPSNFRYIGFIKLAFPEAKIIHLERDAMATCWSIYKNYFDSSGLGFSYNQNDLAKYYGSYREMIEFWHNIFTGQIYDLSYEGLTINQEDEIRNLLEYCDLDWDKNCLNFHKNNRIVKTTSSIQVRRKIYQGSSEEWKKYRDYLKPLINGLKKN